MATNLPEPTSTLPRSQVRREKLNEIKAGNVHIEQKTYHIDDTTIELLNKAYISPEKFTTCTGHQFQHALHKELVTIISLVANQEMQHSITNSKLDTIGETILSFADVGCNYNKQEEMVKAVTLVDWCWSGIELIESIELGTDKAIIAASKGVANGILNTGAIILKPHEIVYNIGIAIKQVAQLTAKLFKEFCILNYLEEFDPPQLVNRLDSYVNNCGVVIRAIEHHMRELGPYGCISQGTEIATEGFFQVKILLQLGRLYSNAIPKINTLAQKFKSNILPKREALLATAEGIEIEVISESIEFLKTEANQAKHGARISGNITTKASEEVVQQVHLRLEQNKHLIQEFDEIINEIAKKVNKEKIGSFDSAAMPVEKYLKLRSDAEKYYAEIRSNINDISLISQNTGIKKHFIEKIKNHVFLEKHILKDGIKYFPAYPDMAAAWQRLIDNKFIYSDLLLLQHEYAEALVMNGLDFSWENTHYIINNFYDWYKAL